MDLSALDQLLKQIQTEYFCRHCLRQCPRKWYHVSNTLCFFCYHFNPMVHSRLAILREVEWFFIRSGEDSIKEFYQDYIKQLNEWCKQFNLSKTKMDLSIERDWDRKIEDIFEMEL